MDSAVLTRLLRSERSNMPDRMAAGAWPNLPLKFADVASHLAAVLRTNHWFPFDPTTRVGSRAVYEGSIVERTAAGTYCVHASRSDARNPYILAEQSKHVFSTAEDAAEFFLRWDTHLPGDLDGWTAVA